MSSNNFILIDQKPDKSGWGVTDRDAEGGVIEEVGFYKEVTDAIRAANYYMEENPVEYGLDIQLLKP